jgi:DNA-directed RNA polymerase subunit RPC12/RpoP
MSFILVAAVLLSMGVAFFFYPRKVEKRTQELAGTVLCKKCGTRIAVSGPSKVHHEFSVKCTACDSRKLYNLVDLTR